MGFLKNGYSVAFGQAKSDPTFRFPARVNKMTSKEKDWEKKKKSQSRNPAQTIGAGLCFSVQCWVSVSDTAECTTQQPPLLTHQLT